ncbi:DUF3231 family protein [Peribacillus sp. SCS-37]|uniref:DUF3231 family protein n=1 Tax=Paraperibacillus esterisolvens TaxID=3115296 RepID=UPI003905D23F
MPDKPTITSSELGALWLTYQQKTMISRMLEYFIEKADEEAAKEIMNGLYNEIKPFISRIEGIFQDSGAVVPRGFTKEDVFTDAAPLYDYGFDIMFIRMIKEISMAMHALNITMSYRKDIILLFKGLTGMTQKYYNESTQYLLERGLLMRSPYVSMPREIEFVEDTHYLAGLNPFQQRRVLNTIEVSQLYHALESNVTGMQMIIGFAQAAKEPEVSKYFMEGAELSKSIIKELRDILLDSDIQVPGQAGGIPTRSTESPFSDKIMLYCVSLFSTFSIGGNSLGTAFSLRHDLPAKISIIMKDIFEYANKGAKLMIKHKWLEQPPSMESRKDIASE